MGDTKGITEYRLTDGTKRYRVRLMRQGVAYKWEGFTTIQQARSWRDDRKQDIRHGYAFPSPTPSASTTFRVVVERYLEESAHKKNINGERNYAAFWIQHLGMRDPQALTPAEIGAARVVLLQRGLAPSTINRYCAWLHHVLEQLVNRDELASNPSRVFVRSARKGGQKLVEPSAPEQVWTDEELRRIAKELGEQILFPLLAILTGLRQGEQFALRKDRIDLVRGTGYLDRTKGNEPQEFVINDDARRILAYFLAQSPTESPWVFPHRRWRGQPMNGKGWYNWVFKPACARAGIVLSRKDGKTWHTLRHSFTDRLVEQGVHLHYIQQAGRWNSQQAMQRYLKRRPEQVRAGVGLLKSPLALEPILYGNGITNTKDDESDGSQ